MSTHRTSKCSFNNVATCTKNPLPFSIFLCACFLLLACNLPNKSSERQQDSTNSSSHLSYGDNKLTTDALRDLYSNPNEPRNLTIEWSDYRQDGTPKIEGDNLQSTIDRVIRDTDDITCVSLRVWKLENSDPSKLPSEWHENGVKEVSLYTISAITSTTVTNKNELIRLLNKLNIKSPDYIDMVSIDFK